MLSKIETIRYIAIISLGAIHPSALQRTLKKEKRRRNGMALWGLFIKVHSSTSRLCSGLSVRERKARKCARERASTPRGKMYLTMKLVSSQRHSGGKRAPGVKRCSTCFTLLLHSNSSSANAADCRRMKSASSSRCTRYLKYPSGTRDAVGVMSPPSLLPPMPLEMVSVATE